MVDLYIGFIVSLLLNEWIVYFPSSCFQKVSGTQTIFRICMIHHVVPTSIAFIYTCQDTNTSSHSVHHSFNTRAIIYKNCCILTWLFPSSTLHSLYTWLKQWNSSFNLPLNHHCSTFVKTENMFPWLQIILFIQYQQSNNAFQFVFYYMIEKLYFMWRRMLMYQTGICSKREVTFPIH